MRIALCCYGTCPPVRACAHIRQVDLLGLFLYKVATGEGIKIDDKYAVRVFRRCGRFAASLPFQFFFTSPNETPKENKENSEK